MSVGLNPDSTKEEFEFKQEDFPVVGATKRKKGKKRKKKKVELQTSKVVTDVIQASNTTTTNVIKASESVNEKPNEKPKVVLLKQTPVENDKPPVQKAQTVAQDLGVAPTPVDTKIQMPVEKFPVPTSTTPVSAEQKEVPVPTSTLPVSTEQKEIPVPTSTSPVEESEKISVAVPTARIEVSTQVEKTAEQSIKELNEAVEKAEAYKELLTGVNTIYYAREVRREILKGYYEKYKEEIGPFLKSHSKLRAELELVKEKSEHGYEDNVYTPYTEKEIEDFKVLGEDTNTKLNKEKEHERALHVYDKQRKQIEVGLSWLKTRETEVTTALTALSKLIVSKKDLNAEDKDTLFIKDLMKCQNKLMSLREAVRLCNFTNAKLYKKDGDTFKKELEKFEADFLDLKKMYHDLKAKNSEEVKYLAETISANKHVSIAAVTKAKLSKEDQESTDRNLQTRKTNREIAETQSKLISSMWKQIDNRIDNLVTEMNNLNYSVTHKGASVGTFSTGYEYKYISPTKEKATEEEEL